LYNTGIHTSDNVWWMFKRAKGFMDVVAYTGDSSSSGTGNTQTINHSLATPPELIIVKRRSASADWQWWHKSFPTGNYMYGDSGQLLSNLPSYHFGTAGASPTNTTYQVGDAYYVNSTGNSYISYLFATLAGVSKVGSYTGTGDTAAQTIDCGFSSGARMVIIKCSSHAGQWYIFDVERGITSTTNDGVLMLNNTTAESPESSAFGSAIDAIQPDSSGFKVQYSDLNRKDVNVSGREYIFLAIA
jgi:hypothetical protein